MRFDNYNRHLKDLLFEIHYNRKIKLIEDKEGTLWCFHTINYNNMKLTIKYPYWEGLNYSRHIAIGEEVMKYILNNLNKSISLNTTYNLMFNEKEKQLLKLLLED